MKEMKVLESVGCVLIDGVVYPQFEDGTPDFDMGVELTELDSDFINALSPEDFELVK
jgi:hypothetical protein